jgi:hypothetical protein
MNRYHSTLLLLLIAPSLTAGALGASCIQGEANRVATIEVTSCSDAAAVLRERVEARGERLQPQGGTVLDRVPGVVVEGRVTRKVHVTQHAAEEFHVEDVVTADEAGTWFVPAPVLPHEPGTGACDAYAKGAAVELYVVEPCCDTFPPSEPACLLDVGAAFPVPAPLAEAVAAFLARSESH